VRWQIEINGLAAHSSMAHLGVNAITYAGRLLGEISTIEAELKTRPPELRFNPPYPTLQVTMIEGGTASNIIPVSCRFGFEVRAIAGLDIEAIETRLRSFIETSCLPEMRAVAPESGITLERTNAVPPFAATPNSEAVALALRLTGKNETFAVSYATEAGLFQDADAPSVICGPGSIDQAHTANEWIAKSELAACSAFLENLGDWAAA
jgi:acetylornithine deacetylase